MSLNVLIVGAGVCGPTLALLLQRASPSHTITVIERASQLRTSGLQLDFKAQGTPIMRKMGLLEIMRSHRVEETGSEVVGAKGETLARYGVNAHVGTEGIGGLTNEIEIMRGDMVRVVYEASLAERKALQDQDVHEGGLKYEFGITIKEMANAHDGVHVTFSDGRTQKFDLVVGADGQNSRTRTMAFGEEVSKKSIQELGFQVAYFSIPRGTGDGTMAKIYFASRSRGVLVRNGGRPRTQVYLFTKDSTQTHEESFRKSTSDQKAVWTEIFRGAGWETERFLEGMQTAEDFYSHELVQIKLPALYKDRVVLIGDSGYCPSVLTGYGTTSSFLGAYILAGELARKASDIDGALEAYNETMKAPVRLGQIMGHNMSLPSSPIAVWFIRNSIWAASTLRIDKLAMKMMPKKKEKTGLEAWPLPEYPELNLME